MDALLAVFKGAFALFCIAHALCAWVDYQKASDWTQPVARDWAIALTVIAVVATWWAA